MVKWHKEGLFKLLCVFTFIGVSQVWHDVSEFQSFDYVDIETLYLK